MIDSVHSIYRVNIFYLTEQDCLAVRRAIEARPQLTLASSFSCNLETTQVGADKGAGLTWLCDYLGVSPKDVKRIPRMPRGSRPRDRELRGLRCGALPHGGGKAPLRGGVGLSALLGYSAAPGTLGAPLRKGVDFRLMSKMARTRRATTRQSERKTA